MEKNDQPMKPWVENARRIAATRNQGTTSWILDHASSELRITPHDHDYYMPASPTDSTPPEKEPDEK